MSSGGDQGVPSGDQTVNTNSSLSSQSRSAQAMAALEYNPGDATPAIPPSPSEGRQPQTLQDILRYSITATSDAPQPAIAPMSNERRAFLEASLRSLTHSTVDRMSACIQVLLLEESQDEQGANENALEQIIDLVDNMDNASDFQKIGGFRVLDPGLHSSDETIRALTATLIAELSQNNLYIQDCILETNLLALLLDMVNNDSDPNVQIKSLYAVSCIVRDHDAALQAFSEQSGWTALLKAMQSSVEKLQLKACFLLSAICAQNSAVIDELCDLGYVEQLCGLLAGVNQCPLVEHLLQALLSMATNSKQAAEMLSLPELQLRRTLSNVLETTEKDMDDYRYAQEIKSVVFGSSYEDDGER